MLLLIRSVFCKGGCVRIYFSNRKLWETIYKIFISLSLLLLILILLLYKNSVFVIILIIGAVSSAGLAFLISKQDQKLYVNVGKKKITVSEFWGEKQKIVEFSSISSLTKSGSNIMISVEGGPDTLIKLEYMNAEDSKKLISLLKFHPAIKKKNFFV